MNCLISAIRLSILALSLGLCSCAIIPKDFSKNPLNIQHDKMKGVTWISSNWIGHYGGTTKGYFSPYFGKKGKNIWLRAKLKATTSSGTLHYRNATLMCNGKPPINIKQKPFENWSKSFDTDCSQYGCKSYEYADISIPKIHTSYILNCKKELTVRLTGSAKYTEFNYTPKSKPNFFKGLNDLKIYLNDSIKEGFKMI